jgi:hypothetical protein
VLFGGGNAFAAATLSEIKKLLNEFFLLAFDNFLEEKDTRRNTLGEVKGTAIFVLVTGQVADYRSRK